MEGTKFLRRKEAAAYLRENYGIATVSCLATYASQGTGPVMQYHGRIPVYPMEGLDAWAKSRMSTPVQRAKRPANPRKPRAKRPTSEAQVEAAE